MSAFHGGNQLQFLVVFNLIKPYVALNNTLGFGSYMLSPHL
jgi:hypothetical protein